MTKSIYISLLCIKIELLEIELGLKLQNVTCKAWESVFFLNNWKERKTLPVPVSEHAAAEFAHVRTIVLCLKGGLVIRRKIFLTRNGHYLERLLLKSIWDPATSMTSIWYYIGKMA